jgi:hypothetical protein
VTTGTYGCARDLAHRPRSCTPPATLGSTPLESARYTQLIRAARSARSEVATQAYFSGIRLGNSRLIDVLTGLERENKTVSASELLEMLRALESRRTGATPPFYRDLSRRGV